MWLSIEMRLVGLRKFKFYLILIMFLSHLERAAPLVNSMDGDLGGEARPGGTDGVNALW